MSAAWLEIDLAALGRNVASVREWVGPATAVMAIVKANAYGHGLVPVARASAAAGAAMLGVARVEEALDLRAGGVDLPILVLGAPPPGSERLVVEAEASQVVSSLEAVRRLSGVAARTGAVVGVHLKIDTGMGRVGAAPEDAELLARTIVASPGLRLNGVCTHFASSDEDAEFTERQNALFRQVLADLKRAGITPRMRHAANSGAVQAHPESRYDMVRPGLLIYGCPPLPGGPRLEPVLSWKSQLTQVRTLPAGVWVGYGGTARLTRDSRIGVVPAGYADGWPRSLSNRGRVLVHGTWAPVIGRVSMDQSTIDLTDVPGAQPGDEVVLIGEQGGRNQPAEEVAAAADTITHELLVRLGSRLERRYLDGNDWSPSPFPRYE